MNGAVKSAIERVVSIVIIFAFYLFRQAHDNVCTEHTYLPACLCAWTRHTLYSLNHEQEICFL